MEILANVGYFSSPEQAKPAFDPGEKAICPVCREPMGPLSPGMTKCRSFRTSDALSHFFYYHAACGQRDMAPVDRFEADAVDAVFALEQDT